MIAVDYGKKAGVGREHKTKTGKRRSTERHAVREKRMGRKKRGK